MVLHVLDPASSVVPIVRGRYAGLAWFRIVLQRTIGRRSKAPDRHVFVSRHLVSLTNFVARKLIVASFAFIPCELVGWWLGALAFKLVGGFVLHVGVELSD